MISRSCDLSQILLYPKVAKLLGYRRSFRAGLVVFSIGCILLPLANQISGPIEINQSDASKNNANSTVLVNNTNTTENDYYYDDDDGVVDDMGGSVSLDDILTNDTCHSSRLESSTGANSIGHIPARVWLTVSWIMIMITLGRYVMGLSGSGNFLITIVRTLLFTIVKSIMIVGLLVFLIKIKSK